MMVLAASAILAYLFREAGHRIVEKYVESACISTINLSESAGRFTGSGSILVNELSTCNDTRTNLLDKKGNNNAKTNNSILISFGCTD